MSSVMLERTAGGKAGVNTKGILALIVCSVLILGLFLPFFFVDRNGEYRSALRCDEAYKIRCGEGDRSLFSVSFPVICAGDQTGYIGLMVMHSSAFVNCKHLFSAWRNRHVPAQEPDR